MKEKFSATSDRLITDTLTEMPCPGARTGSCRCSSVGQSIRLVSGRSAVRIRSPAPSISDVRKRDPVILGTPSARCAQRLSSFHLRSGSAAAAAAGLPIRLRPGLSQLRSLAWATARPGPPAGHRERGFAGDPEHRQPRGRRRLDRIPRPIWTREARADRTSRHRWRAIQACVPVAIADTCMPRLRNRSLAARCPFPPRPGPAPRRQDPHATSAKPAAPARAVRPAGCALAGAR